MKTLRENILGTFGSEGKDWLSNLDQIVKFLEDFWQLRDVKPVENMTYHYVAKAFDQSNVPVILKVGCRRELVETETFLLNHFEGHGVVRVLDYEPRRNALLLQQAVPGITLKSLYPEQSEYTMDVYTGIVSQLLKVPIPNNHEFKHVADWLEALDHADSDRFPKGMIQKGITLREKMLSSMQTVKLLHGDLHLDNILKNGNEWLAIDPKGVLGDPEFEVAAFDFISEDELENATTDMFVKRIRMIADRSGLSYERLKNWTFIRLLLSAAWSIENMIDPRKAIKLAQLIFS